MTRDDDETVPTIGAMLCSKTSPRWCWAYCEREGCGYYAPIAFAPFAIRYGMEASTNLIRRHLRCARCGATGATLRHPSWAGTGQGWQTWPSRFT